MPHFSSQRPSVATIATSWRKLKLKNEHFDHWRAVGEYYFQPIRYSNELTYQRMDQSTSFIILPIAKIELNTFECIFKIIQNKHLVDYVFSLRWIVQLVILHL